MSHLTAVCRDVVTSRCFLSLSPFDKQGWCRRRRRFNQLREQPSVRVAVHVVLDAQINSRAKGNKHLSRSAFIVGDILLYCHPIPLPCCNCAHPEPLQRSRTSPASRAHRKQPILLSRTADSLYSIDYSCIALHFAVSCHIDHPTHYPLHPIAQNDVQ